MERRTKFKSCSNLRSNTDVCFLSEYNPIHTEKPPGQLGTDAQSRRVWMEGLDGRVCVLLSSCFNDSLC